MAQYNQPRRLETSSLAAVGEFVSNLCVRLVELTAPDCSSVDPNKLLHAEKACAYLQHKFHTTVSPKLANDLVSEMLKHMDYCYKDICDYVDKEPWCEKILQGFVKAILHPEVTVLDLTFDWQYIVNFITSQIYSLRKLRVLKLTKRNGTDMIPVYVKYDEKWVRPLVNNMYEMSCLETLHVLCCCTDDVLRAAGKWCKQLKHLDVTKSINVTDRSVGDILKMPYLEELNLAGTLITENGYTDLIQGLCQNETHEHVNRSHAMKSFGCDCYSTSQLNCIAEKFVNLIEVSIVGECDLSVLRELKNLQMLSVKNGRFFRVKELLLSKGEGLSDLKLELLELDVNVSVDLVFIVEKCPNLRSLTVVGDTCANNVVGFKVYPRITHLTLQTQNPSAVEILLSRCHNLTVLSLYTVPEFYDDFMSRMFTENPLTNLKELTVGSHFYDMTSDAVKLITNHCMNLSVFNILGYFEGENRYLYYQYPGIRWISYPLSGLVDGYGDDDDDEDEDDD